MLPTPQHHLLIFMYSFLAFMIGGWVYTKYNKRFLYYI